MDNQMENELRRSTEQNRERIEAVNLEIQLLKAQHITLQLSLEEKHQQNRRDIHEVRNKMQEMTDKFLIALDAVKVAIHGMQLTSAKAKGYWLGVGAAVTFVFEMAKIAIEHYAGK